MGYVLEKRGERVRVLECGTLPAQSIQELTRKDVGTGISLFHLIRTDFDKASIGKGPRGLHQVEAGSCCSAK